MSGRVRVVSSGGERPRRGPSLALLVVALALIVGAFAVGRVTAPARHRASAPSSSTATAPSTDSQPAPARVVDGVAVGYPHTQAGAVAALLSDGQTLSDPHVLFDDRRRTQVLSLIATARYARTFSGSGGQALDRAERETALGRGILSGAQTVFLSVPVAYRVVSYTPQAVKVVGYGVSVVANDQGLAPRASWATSTTTAVWQDGDWRVDSASSSDGPTPAATDQPSPASAFLSALAGASEVRDAP